MVWVIFDEADSISIINVLESRAYFSWFITSPQNLFIQMITENL